jgi:hypothetical protein
MSIINRMEYTNPVVPTKPKRDQENADVVE